MMDDAASRDHACRAFQRGAESVLSTHRRATRESGVSSGQRSGRITVRCLVCLFLVSCEPDALRNVLLGERCLFFMGLGRTAVSPARHGDAAQPSRLGSRSPTLYSYRRALYCYGIFTLIERLFSQVSTRSHTPS